MSEFKGTKGAWEANEGVLDGNHILIRGGDYAVAKVYNQERGMEAVNEANARLIAACPEMHLIVARRADCGDKDALALMEKINGSA